MENTKLLNEFIKSETMKNYLINEKKDFLFGVSEMISICFNSYDSSKKIKHSFLREIKRSFDLNYETGKIIKENIGYNKYPENLYVWVPIPFKVGDTVKLHDTGERWVVVNANIPTGKIAEMSDNIDNCITVVPFKYKHLITEEFLNEREAGVLDEIFLNHEHFSVWDTELIQL
ncbi:hypothetical protein [Clostridium algidicarnis]|uniref:hypothetical protein n=1 Tax=Clostridium algidicarnis TaxID=37659 RepID=UPI0016233703|nr:hypothetical protein [Clostridium algidicarnis]MBB6698580.1 hypothetical protein [Clostridium algidicarnis]